MPRYILLTSLTPEGRKTLKERPYRMKEVDKEIESMVSDLEKMLNDESKYSFLELEPFTEIFSSLSSKIAELEEGGGEGERGGADVFILLSSC